MTAPTGRHGFRLNQSLGEVARRRFLGALKKGDFTFHPDSWVAGRGTDGAVPCAGRRKQSFRDQCVPKLDLGHEEKIL